jgi:hypothetical protein
MIERELVHTQHQFQKNASSVKPFTYRPAAAAYCFARCRVMGTWRRAKEPPAKREPAMKRILAINTLAFIAVALPYLGLQMFGL